MEFIKATILNKHQRESLNKLWNDEYPENFSHSDLSDFESYLNNLAKQSHILLVNDRGEIKGWYFDFIRENEKWFAMISDSKVHGKGFGSKLLKLAKEKEQELNGWVIDHNNDKKHNGETYKSPIEFYRKNGFEILPTNRLELDKLSAVKIKWQK